MNKNTLNTIKTNLKLYFYADVGASDIYRAKIESTENSS